MFVFNLPLGSPKDDPFQGHSRTEVSSCIFSFVFFGLLLIVKKEIHYTLSVLVLMYICYSWLLAAAVILIAVAALLYSYPQKYAMAPGIIFISILATWAKLAFLYSSTMVACLLYIGLAVGAVLTVPSLDSMKKRSDLVTHVMEKEAKKREGMLQGLSRVIQPLEKNELVYYNYLIFRLGRDSSQPFIHIGVLKMIFSIPLFLEEELLHKMNQN